MSPISVLILTKNEEQDLPGCLESVRWCDDIHVYDSMSSDNTVPIARSFGAHVVQRFFDDWASHQNWGLRNIKFKHPWVFYLDADERMTPELVTAVQTAVSAPAACVAFRVRRRDFFTGIWLKHVQATSHYIRLFQPAIIRYERLVNPVSVVDGPVGSIEGFLDHFPFSKGIEHWLDRHNSYSEFEARQIDANRTQHSSFSIWKAITAPDFNERRFHQKELFYRLPLRPVVKFLLLYVGKRGFIDGRAGFVYAILQAIYEFMIVLKQKELALDRKEQLHR